MSLSLKAGRVLATLVLWLIVVLGLFQEGTRLSLQALIQSRLSSRAPVRVKLLRLRAYSPHGEGLFRGVRIAWKGVRVSIAGGLRADAVELGPALAPVLRARSVTLTGSWSTVRGRVGSLSVSAARPEWRKLAGPPGAPGPWEMRLPFEVDVSHLRVTSPLGALQGRASLWGDRDGRRGAWSTTLDDTAGRRVEASGRWDVEGGQCWAQVSGGPWGDWEGELDFTPETVRIRADAWTPEGSWSLDGSGRRGHDGRIVLWRKGASRARAMAFLSFRLPGPGGRGWELEDLHGSLELPPVPLGVTALFREGTLTLESPESGTGGCVSASLTGRVETAAGTFGSRCTLQAASREDAGSEVAVAGALWPEGDTTEGPLPSGLDWFVQSFRSPEGTIRVRGQARSPGSFEVSFSADGTSMGWSGEARLKGTAGGLECRGEAGNGKWKVSGTGQLQDWRNTRTALPLPVGPLAVRFGAAGSGLSPASLTVDATGASSWTGSLENGSWRLRVRNGGLSSRDLRLTDLNASLSGEQGAEPTWHARVEAGGGEVAGNALGALKLQVEGRGLQTDCQADLGLPSLGGRAQARLTLSAPEGELRVEKGTLHLLGEAVVFSGIGGTMARPLGTERPWSCERAEVFGETLHGVQGTFSFRDGVARLTATAHHWGGLVHAGLDLGGGRRPVLELVAKDVEAQPLPPFLGHWIHLPLGAEQGLLDGTVHLPLDDPVEGLEVAMHMKDVSLEVGGRDHLFRKASGLLRAELSGGVFTVPEGAWTVEGGAVPLRLGLTASDQGTTIRFSTDVLPMGLLQNAAFDFLPEFLSFASVEGRAAVSGELTSRPEEQTLAAELAFDGAGFLSEDKSIRLRGITGKLPLLVRFGEARQGVPGYPPVEMTGFADRFESMGNKAHQEVPLRVERVRFSVFTMDDLQLFPSMAGGNLVLRLVKAGLWQGKGRGEVALALSTEGIRYVGTFLLAGASLTTFCDQSGALKGFIGGDLYGGITFSGEGAGLDAVRAVATLWVDPEGGEARVISRDFLVKMGGERIKSVLHAPELEYDQAVLKCGLTDGTLTFYDFVLNHKANPVKAVLRKDVSFEVRLPARNSVSLRQLIERIKGLEGGNAEPADAPQPEKRTGGGQ